MGSEMKPTASRLTLARPAVYTIRVPGHIMTDWSDWAEDMTLEREHDGHPVTTMRGVFDQAALHGLLRRLYSLGFPLISVECIRITDDFE